MSPRPRYFEALVIIGYIAAVLLGAALLAPVLLVVGQGFLSFASARGWRDSQWIGWIVKAAETTRLPGYFDRAALIVALTGLWPLFRALKLTRADTVGTERFPGGIRNGLRGFILAAAVIALMGVVFSMMDVCCRASDSPAWRNFGPPIVSGLCVAVIEEFLFRGAMLGVLRRSFQPRMAMLVTTGLFAVLHFLKPPARDAFKDPEVKLDQRLRRAGAASSTALANGKMSSPNSCFCLPSAGCWRRLVSGPADLAWGLEFTPVSWPR